MHETERLKYKFTSHVLIHRNFLLGITYPLCLLSLQDHSTFRKLMSLRKELHSFEFYPMNSRLELSSYGGGGGQQPLRSRRNRNDMLSGELADLEAHRRRFKQKSRRRPLEVWTGKLCETLNYLKEVFAAYPSIPILSFTAFAILFGTGLAVILSTDKAHRESSKSDALGLAIDTGNWFCKCALESATTSYRIGQ